MKRRFFTITVVLIIGLAVGACLTPPKDEMNRAQDAVARAENDADAVAYAGNTLIRAKEALMKMNSEADAKRFSEARSYAAEAIALAEQAIAEGRTGAERARQQAATLLNSLGGPLEETSSALSAARADPDMPVDFDALSHDMDSTRQAYDDAWQSLQEENYRDALVEGQNVRSSLSAINNTLNIAAQQIARKK